MKAGTKFICTDNYVMDSGSVAFVKNKTYDVIKIQSDGYFTMKSEVDSAHRMIIDEEFPDYFKEIFDYENQDERIKFIQYGLKIKNIELHNDLLVKVLKIIDKVDELKGMTTLKDITDI